MMCFAIRTQNLLDGWYGETMSMYVLNRDCLFVPKLKLRNFQVKVV